MFPSKCTWNGRAPCDPGSHMSLWSWFWQKGSHGYHFLSVNRQWHRSTNLTLSTIDQEVTLKKHMFMTEEKSMLLKHKIQFRAGFNIWRWRLVVGMSSNGVLPQCTSITDVEVHEPMYGVSLLINVEFTDFYNLQSAFHWLLHSKRAVVRIKCKLRKRYWRQVSNKCYTIDNQPFRGYVLVVGNRRIFKCTGELDQDANNKSIVLNRLHCICLGVLATRKKIEQLVHGIQPFMHCLHHSWLPTILVQRKLDGNCSRSWKCFLGCGSICWKSDLAERILFLARRKL